MTLQGWSDADLQEREDEEDADWWWAQTRCPECGGETTDDPYDDRAPTDCSVNGCPRADDDCY